MATPTAGDGTALDRKASGGGPRVDSTAGGERDRREALQRRRRVGLLIGSFLAFALGSWPGLALAWLMVGIVAIADYMRSAR
jgi:hypothetical protein